MGVYFIRTESGPVKIGYTDGGSADGRVSALQTGSHEILEVVAFSVHATQDDEKALHRRFARSRIHGEWFRSTAELESLIAYTEKMGSLNGFQEFYEATPLWKSRVAQNAVRDLDAAGAAKAEQCRAEALAALEAVSPADIWEALMREWRSTHAHAGAPLDDRCLLEHKVITYRSTRTLCWQNVWTNATSDGAATCYTAERLLESIGDESATAAVWLLAFHHTLTCQRGGINAREFVPTIDLLPPAAKTQLSVEPAWHRASTDALPLFPLPSEGSVWTLGQLVRQCAMARIATMSTWRLVVQWPCGAYCDVDEATRSAA